ncbi:MAG: hypothetical protein JSR64_07285, partial [Nitrospira sp.]|nr:hypothetical protein [Nitrospira sp.]
MSRPMVKRLALILFACLGSLALQAQSSAGAAQTPSASRMVSLPLGQVDAVTDQLSMNLPLGPRLPGRIPLGFSWSYLSPNGATGMFSAASQAGVYRPVLWPMPGDPSATLQTTVLINGQPWVFYPQASNPSMPSSSAWWMTAMVARGVSIQQPTAAPVDYTITGAGTFYATTAPSSDGTKFLVSFGYTMPVEHLDRSTGTSSAATLNLGQGYAILDGPNAIWAQFMIQNAPLAVGATRDQITHFTNAWGDHVTVDETSTLLSGLGDCWAPEKIVIADQHAQASITLQITATPTLKTGTFLLFPGNPSSAEPCTEGATCGSASMVITSSINGMALPRVTLNGYWRGAGRGSLPPTMQCPGYNPQQAGVYYGVLDWWFIPSSIQATASDGTSRTTTLSWPTYPDGSVQGQVSSLTLPGGLQENFTWGSTVTYSLYSFSPCNGYWSGFTLVSNGVSLPSNPSSFSEPPGDDVLAGTIAPTKIVMLDGSGQTPGETILISRVGPTWTGLGDQQSVTWTMKGSVQHVTTILRYPTSSPDSGTAFRGTRLTHPSLDSLNVAGGDATGLKGYLFATSAILEEEAIYGSGMPDSSGQLSNATVYRTTVYDGFDLHSWANPSGALGTGLPVAPIARRTRVFTPGLPTRTILAGDPGTSAACDVYGPIQTDEWTGPEQTSIPAASDLMSGTASSSQVSTANSGIAGSVHRQGVIHRHFDWTLLRLLTDTDQKTLDGDALLTIRGVSSVDFGTTSYSYDPLGRIKDETGVRGGYSANEHRTYN